MGKLGWLGVAVLCASLAIHNAARMAPTPLIEEFRVRYDASEVMSGTTAFWPSPPPTDLGHTRINSTSTVSASLRDAGREDRGRPVPVA